jgi:hypothetical protein
VEHHVGDAGLGLAAQELAQARPEADAKTGLHNLADALVGEEAAHRGHQKGTQHLQGPRSGGEAKSR